MTIITLILGFLFGSILQFSRLNRFNTISGMSMLKDLTMAKAIAVAIGLGIILVNIEISLGMASYHVKPLILGGLLTGGIIFGIGMAVLGYCPGTLPISLGEGSIDAFTGIAGGLAGGIVYTAFAPAFSSVTGPNLGQISLNSSMGSSSTVFYLLLFVIGGAFIATAFALNRIGRTRDYRWLWSGIGIAVICAVLFLTSVTDRVLGASGTYPYAGAMIAGITDNEYFKSIEKSGNWELIFLSGAFLSGLILSLIRGDFKLTLIHENWRMHRDNSKAGRIFWSFAGGFLLIIGARLAGGCTSGHIISGGIQLAASSYIFAAAVFGSFLLTGKLFYRKTDK